MISLNDLITYIQINPLKDLSVYNPFKHKNMSNHESSYLYKVCERHINLMIKGYKKYHVITDRAESYLKTMQSSFKPNAYFTGYDFKNGDRIVCVYVPVHFGVIDQQKDFDEFIGSGGISNLVMCYENENGGLNHIHITFFSKDIDMYSYIQASTRLLLNARRFVANNTFESYRTILEVYLLNRFRFQDVASFADNFPFYSEFDRIITLLDIEKDRENTVVPFDIEVYDHNICSILNWANSISFPVDPEYLRNILFTDVIAEPLFQLEGVINEGKDFTRY